MDLDDSETSGNAPVGKFTHFEMVHYVEVVHYKVSVYHMFRYARLSLVLGLAMGHLYTHHHP
jgi:hypothetical protein